MTLNELLRVFWQRKLLVIAVTLAVVIPAYAATLIVPRQYESTSTLTLAPVGSTNILEFTILDQVVPSYAEVATSSSTLQRAEEAMGRPLADISVQTFKGTGIIKVKARSTDRPIRPKPLMKIRMATSIWGI